MYIFINANKNLALSLATYQAFLYEICLKEAQNSSIIAAILNCSLQPGRVFLMPFCPREFDQMEQGF